MGINFNNFVNVGLNQKTIDTLETANLLKGEWREEKANHTIINIDELLWFQNYQENNPEIIKSLEGDYRDIFIETFGHYHFTVMTNNGFHYVWKIMNNHEKYYVYVDHKGISLEANVRAKPENIQNLLVAIHKLVS